MSKRNEEEFYLHLTLMDGLEVAKNAVRKFWDEHCADLPDAETFERMVFLHAEHERFNEEQRMIAMALGTKPILL